MTVKVGINGFGRIGRLAFRRIKEVSDDIEVVAINDLTSPTMLAQLLQFDSTHGTYPGTVTATEDSIVVDGEATRVYAEPDASKIPWAKENGVDIVLECTGNLSFCDASAPPRSGQSLRASWSRDYGGARP